MREPKRLLADGATDFERRLLGAVVGERPSPMLRSRMRRGLGLVGPLAWASNVKAMFSSLTTKAAVGVAVGSIVTAGSIMTVVSLGAAGRAEGARDRNDSPTQVMPPAAPSAIEPMAPAASSGAAMFEPGPSVATAVSPSATETGGENGRLRAEIAALDSVRSALRQGARARAMSALDAYAREFPAGVLSQEAAMLRQQAARDRTTRARATRRGSAPAQPNEKQQP
jgi:hypothetical protein